MTRKARSTSIQKAKPNSTPRFSESTDKQTAKRRLVHHPALTDAQINVLAERVKLRSAGKLPDLRLEGQLTPQECATVLHGLRMIQETANGPDACVSGTCEHFDDYPALTDAEIDALCERINLGPAPQSKTWTPPNAAPFLKMRDNDDHTVTAPCGCLLEPIGGTGAAFYQCETHERAARALELLEVIADFWGL